MALSPTELASVFFGLPRQQRKALGLLVLCHELQLPTRLVNGLVSDTMRTALRTCGLLDDASQVPPGLRESLGALARRDPQRPSAERALAAQLMSEPAPSPEAQRMVAKLLSESPHDALLQRLGRTWSTGDASGAVGPEVVQTQLDRLALRKRLSARARLRTYRSNAEGYDAQVFRDLFDTWATATAVPEQLLAHSGLVRAALWCGLRALPPQVEESLSWVRAHGAGTDLRGQVELMWASHHLMLRALEPAAAAPVLLEHLEQAGVDAPTRQGLLLGARGVHAAHRADNGTASETLMRCSQDLRRDGLHHAAHLVDRLLAVVLFLDNRLTELAPLLTEVADSDRSERREYLLLFEALLAWYAGDRSLLEGACRGLPQAPSADAHPLLPRPFFRDYLPFAFAILNRRAAGLPPDLAHVDILCEALERLRFFFAISLAAVALAQHCLLWGERDAAHRLALAVRNTPATALHGETLLRMCEHVEGPCNLPALLETLSQVRMRADAETMPYYVVLTTRCVLHHRLDRDAFARALPRVLSGFICDGIPGRILAACDAALSGDEYAVPEACPITGHILARLRMPTDGPAPDASPPDDVLALRQHLAAHFHAPFNLGAYAQRMGLSANALARRFTRHVGRSPKQFQVDLRLARAAELITQTDWDLTRIALECGFYDAPQLTRAFRAHTGSSPQRYRQRFT